MSIFDQIGKATAKMNNATAKVGGAIIKGVSAVKAVEAIGPNAVTKISNTIKTAVSMADNVERQIRETYLGRKALEGIDKLSENIVGGTINASNMHLFQDTNLMKGLVNLKSPILNGSVGAFSDVADMVAYMQPEESAFLSGLATSRVAAGEGSWEYASAGAELANTKSNQYTPKYKFQFIVDIQLAPELEGITTAAAQKSFTFLATEVDRPTFKYQMEEVNSYNFRFSVPKKLSFDPVTVSMLDDNANDAMRLMMSIVKSISPVMNSFRTIVDIESTDGMNFTDQQTYYDKTNNAYLAGVGPVQGADMWMSNQTSDSTSPIATVTIYHLYDKSGSVNMYQYVNPKVTDIALDKVSMLEGTGPVNEIKMSFVYDWVNVTDSLAAAEQQQNIERSISTAKLVVDSQSTAQPTLRNGPVSYQNNAVLESAINPTFSLPSVPVIPKITQSIQISNLSTGPSLPSQLTSSISWKDPSSSDVLGDWINNLEN